MGGRACGPPLCGGIPPATPPFNNLSRQRHRMDCVADVRQRLLTLAHVVDNMLVPLQERTETVSDDADLEDVYNTRRHLLYVACTRARDHLLLSGVEPASEFLDDLQLQ